MADLRAFIVQYLALPGAILKVSFIGQLRIPEVGSAELPYSDPHSLRLSCSLGTRSLTLHFFAYRKIHLYRSEVSPGAADGLLSDSDVHSQPAHCHPVLGLLLDQHGCCPCPCRPRHHHCPHHDNPELWIEGLFAQGEGICKRAYLTSNRYFPCIVCSALSYSLSTLDLRL